MTKTPNGIHSIEAPTPTYSADWVASLPGDIATRIARAQEWFQYDFTGPKRPVLSSKPDAAEARRFADLMDTWEKAKTEFESRKAERMANNSAIHEAIIAHVKAEGGLASVPEQYRERVWARATEDNTNDYLAIYHDLETLVSIFT